MIIYVLISYLKIKHMNTLPHIYLLFLISSLPIQQKYKKIKNVKHWEQSMEKWVIQKKKRLLTNWEHFNSLSVQCR